MYWCECLIIDMSLPICRTAHEKSHQHADERLNKLKWPWEREQNGFETDGPADPEEQNYSNKDLYYKYK